MKGRKVYRDNTVIYPDLYYIWTWRPDKYWKLHDRITEHSLYKKHICGIGFYSRYHAKHVLTELLGVDVLMDIHIIRGKRLLKQGITTVPKNYSDKIFFKGEPRLIKRWIYPPEFRYDSHRRRHFIVYLVRSAEDHGIKAFNAKYKRYFYGYRQSFPWWYYKQKKRKIIRTLVQEICSSKGITEEEIREVCPWIFNSGTAACFMDGKIPRKISQEEILHHGPEDI